MKKEIISVYNLTTDGLEIRAFGSGLINTTLKIKNADGEYILQRINDHVFKDPNAIAFNVRALADYLGNLDHGYLFVAPIKTNYKEDLLYVEGDGYYRLSYYVKQSHTIDVVGNTLQAYEAAKMFGAFTKKLSAFPVQELKVTLPDFHNLTLRYQQFNNALTSGNKERIRTSAQLADFIIAHKNIVDNYEKMLHNPLIKLRVTHHDTKISNVLFNDDDKGLCVIDLDTVMPGYFISDVGDMMRTYLSPVDEEEKDFSKIEIRETYFAAICKGYLSEMHNELTVDEKRQFIYSGQFMIYMQAVRFLTDYLNNDVYYKITYADQNLIRARNQIVLLQRFMEKEGVFNEILKNELHNISLESSN